MTAKKTCRKVSRVDRTLNFILTLIASRRRSAQQERDEAIAGKRWSFVPGRDGIDTGLLIAESIVKDAMRNPLPPKRRVKP